jgi:hypothetical protein
LLEHASLMVSDVVVRSFTSWFEQSGCSGLICFNIFQWDQKEPTFVPIKSTLLHILTQSCCLFCGSFFRTGYETYKCFYVVFMCVWLTQFRNLLKFAKNTVTVYDLVYSCIKITLQPNPRLQLLVKSATETFLWHNSTVILTGSSWAYFCVTCHRLCLHLVFFFNHPQQQLPPLFILCLRTNGEHHSIASWMASQSVFQGMHRWPPYDRNAFPLSSV